MKWRRATVQDLGAIESVAAAIHTELPESREVFAERLRLFPEGCFVLDNDGESVGYCVAHPWLLGSVPALNRLVIRLPPSPDCIFIHDIAVLSRARGRGAGGELLNRLIAVAGHLGIGTLALVSVYGTYPFWERFGFEVTEDARLVGKLAAYGDSARYMIRRPD